MLNKRTIGMRVGVVVAILLATMNLLWLLSKYGSLYQTMKEGVSLGGSVPLISQQAIRRDLMVELAILVGAIGLWYRRVIGVWVSLTALAWVGFEYVWWYLWTKQVVAAAGLTELPSGVPQRLNLGGATGWNVVVLVVCLVLFVWELRIAKQTLEDPNVS